MKVLIVGLGCQPGETCTFCGECATIYVSLDTADMLPACNKCVGPGELGKEAELKDGARLREYDPLHG